MAVLALKHTIASTINNTVKFLFIETLDPFEKMTFTPAAKQMLPQQTCFR